MQSLSTALCKGHNAAAPATQPTPRCECHLGPLAFLKREREHQESAYVKESVQPREMTQRVQVNNDTRHLET